MPFDSRTLDATPAVAPATDRRALARFLLFVAGLVWVMVAIGGATRLTGSGLSIMEWAPLAGVLPPLSEAEWQRLYDLYRTIPQYALVNQGFGLEGFKEIFWLEWIHRFWGRLIGLAYVGGLAWFWLRGRIPPGLKPRLLLLLALGGLQGAIGWFMVASGFEADRTAVSPYRLVIHLGMAFLLYGVLVWTALSLLRPQPDQQAPPRALRAWVHIAAGLAVLLHASRKLEALALGEDSARSLGVDVGRLKLTVVIGTALAVGPGVAVAGFIGFVGLLVPHALRPFVGSRPSRLLPLCALGGALATLLADIACRLVPTLGELKLGIVTALFGAPFFLWLLTRERRLGA